MFVINYHRDGAQSNVVSLDVFVINRVITPGLSFPEVLSIVIQSVIYVSHKAGMKLVQVL